MSGKKLPSKPSRQKFRHIRLQGSEFVSVPTAYLADSRKAFCEVCIKQS